MIVVHNWEVEYDKYKEDNFKRNENIYDYMSNQQIEVIKQYYRWMSRKRFFSYTNDTSLRTLPEKALTLSYMIGDITDWRYDGCIDTGYFGGGKCDLGHTLRYEHYAISDSTGMEIIFGVKCASDFFGIEPKKLTQINKVQEEIQEEIKKIAFILYTGKYKKYLDIHYKDLLEIVAELKPYVNEILGNEWNKHMANFLGVGLPFTKSMIERIEYIRNSVIKKRREDNKLKEDLKNIDAKCNDGISLLNMINNLENSETTFGRLVNFQNEEFVSYIKRYVSAETSSVRNITKLSLALAQKTELVYKNNKNCINNILDGLDRYGYSEVSLEDMWRISLLYLIIKEDCTNIVADVGLSGQLLEYLKKNKLAPNNTDDKEYYVGYASENSIFYKIMSNLKLVKLTLEWVENNLNFNVKNGLNMLEMAEELISICDKLDDYGSEWIIGAGYNIASRIKNGDKRFSLKQQAIFIVAFKILEEKIDNREKELQNKTNNSGENKDTKSLPHRENERLSYWDYKDNIDKICDYSNYDFLPDIVFKIIYTVEHSGSISAKQKKWLDEALEAIDKFEEEKKVKRQKQIETNKIQEKTREESYIKVQHKIEKVKEGKNVELMSVSEISEVLGQGLFE